MYKYLSLSSQKGEPHHLSQTRRGRALAKAALPGALPAELRSLSHGPPRLLQSEDEKSCEMEQGTPIPFSSLLQGSASGVAFHSPSSSWIWE